MIRKNTGRKNEWFSDLKKYATRFICHGRVILVILGLSLLADFHYTEADDWVRTLGYNYDLFGRNTEIHTLYLGSDRMADIKETGHETVSDREESRSCDLRSAGQSMKESYFLLGKADRRYRLDRVYLCRENHGDSEGGTKENRDDMEYERTEEDSYLQKIVTYCEERGILLIVAESGAQSSAFFSKC